MINCNRRDGSARAVNEVAERLARRGHEVHLYARKAEALDLEAVQWHRVPGRRITEVWDFATYRALVDPRGPFPWGRASARHAVRHSVGPNAPHANVITIQNIQPAKRRHLVRLEGERRLSPARRLSRWAYLEWTTAAEKALYTWRGSRERRARPPVFLPVSRGVEAELRAHYDIGPAEVRIVPNAADTERFRPLDETARRAWREANGLGAEDQVAIFAGGEWARKGLDLAIRGLARAVAGNPASRLKLFVAGDDPNRAAFATLVGELGLGERVLFGGFRADVEEALGAADLFLFPSWYEAFSLATIEAAACGLPIVATRINGTEDFVLPGVTGVFVEPEPEAIGAALRSLVADAAHLQAMGRAGRARVEREYTWDRVTQMTEAAYAGV
jgi:UDP-glucose:(heptosyl)LPS alpha-1,3-glucosyltransferase